jgi:hypothetical protein
MNGAVVSFGATPEPNIYRLQTLALPCVRIRASSLSLLSRGGGTAPRCSRNPARRRPVWRQPQPQARPGGGRRRGRARPALQLSPLSEVLARVRGDDAPRRGVVAQQHPSVVSSSSGDFGSDIHGSVAFAFALGFLDFLSGCVQHSSPGEGDPWRGGPGEGGPRCADGTDPAAIPHGPAVRWRYCPRICGT